MTTMNERNASVIEEFRPNGGKIGGRFMGAPMVLLTSKGAKTGHRRTRPLVCLPEGDRLYVFASRGGAPNNPAWYHNLRANPKVIVEFGTEAYEAEAKVLTGEERDRVYARQSELRPQYAEYQRNTTRKIPVVALVRI
ncbi:MAG: nitroreductase family deazaflavin-dependent oxidoreductase [Dehalococcoidia bacterium]|nr:nitroreductase family deazaflavin-dependent oxidoreductase [Dehalococcoidia bacterium]